MKYIVSYCIIATLALFSIGCSKTDKIMPDTPDDSPAFIEISSEKVVFDADGGNVTLTVATNIDNWDFTTEGDWFTATRGENNSIVIETVINGAPETLTGSVTIKGEKDGKEFSATTALVQRAERSISLSSEATANCYIVQTNKSYKFDATVKGNGKSDGDGKSGYIAAYGLEIKDVASVELLWEARNDGDRSMSREIIDGAPTYTNGYIAFSTGRSEGNAVIVAKDIKGYILWSWHIWVCNDEITSHDQINGNGDLAGQIMDRNLGALNNKPMDIDNRGMFYQWGRKDPFMPSLSPYHEDTNSSDVAEYNVDNLEVGNGSGEWLFTAKTLPLTTPPGNIVHSIQNPMVYLLAFYSNYYDWYCASNDPKVTAPGLWGYEKTIFDPCPAGYKVPGKNVWSLPSGNKSVRNGGPVEDYDESGVSEEWDWNIAKDCGRVWKYTGDYYPMVGNIYYTSERDPAHNYTGGQGFYWTCEPIPDSTTADSYNLNFNGYWGLFRNVAHVFSAQIRCVKE